MRVRVLRPEQMRAWESASLAPGAEADALMRRAGEAAARRIRARVPAVRTAGAVIHAGRGNNGGDAWVVADALAEAGCPVHILAALMGHRSTAMAAKFYVRDNAEAVRTWAER